MSERESGRIVNVTSDPLGSVLSADALTGDGTVTVDDAGDFDEMSGGTLSIGGVQYGYTAVDNDTGVLTLAGTLSADAFAGDRVDVWDVALGEQARDITAFIELPVFQANDDAIPATVWHSLVPLLAEGIREPGQGETVRLERDGDSYEVVDVTGKRAKIVTSFERMTAVQTVAKASLTGTSGNYSLPFGWTLLTDEGGDVITLGPSGGYTGLYVFEPGEYAINLTLYPGIVTASASMMLQLGVNCAELNNTPTATWHGDEAVSGSTPFASGSLTNYFDGRGLSGGVYPYLIYKNVDAATTSIDVYVEVVRVR